MSDKEHPLPCTAEVVRAILNGKQTQARRPIKSQPPEGIGEIIVGAFHPTEVDRQGEEYPGEEIYGAYSDCGEWGCKSPFGKPGDVLWVKEKWQPLYDYCNPGVGIVGACFRHMGGGRIFNKAHKGYMSIDDTYQFRPSSNMPKWACRLCLTVKRVWVERVQDISASDDANPWVWACEFEVQK